MCSMSEPEPSHPGPAWRPPIDASPSGRLGLLAGLVGIAAAVAIVVTLPRLWLWHLDLIYLEPWYDGAPPACDQLYRSFIDRQLMLTGLPLIVTNVLTLVVLWASLRKRNAAD